MSELNAFDITVAEEGYSEGYVKYRRAVYDKSEVDKVIAEKDKEIQRLENLCASYRHDCDNLAIREANALKEIGRDNRVIRHQKHKRCLAMANYLGLVSALVHGETQLEYMRRELKWLKLAEKFKEAK